MGELHSFILTIFVCILYHFLKRKISFWYKMNIDCSVWKLCHIAFLGKKKKGDVFRMVCSAWIEV